MKICTIYSDVSDKIKSVIFAKRIAEEEAKAAQKKKIIIICVCAGVAVLAAAAAVAIYVLSKKESVRNKVNVIITGIKSKLPSKKEEACEECDCGFEEEACECVVDEAPVADAE